jgi:hypothetical protein
VVWPWLWQPAGDHVGVADCLDLVHALRIGEPVERGGSAWRPDGVRERTGYRSSEAELSAVRKLNPFGTCD